MKVKRLELQGFKSFKDKTVIHFDDGVTGIVGPNGCGKSNIVDSFFWVMGEQSAKHLRGTSSADLIFSGSEKYSGASLAEVTMVLSTGAPKDGDLPDGATVRDLPAHMRYQEIAVTRRLYRSGDSEYLINGQTCRLKDIHELFMDTGAGPKAYSIIEQGQISKIVASKPEDRRVLIEEAAGISKFKARKKESLRKIEATQTNLARINDIIAEIERQLGTLERQVGKARQYKKLKEELQSTEMLLGRKKLFDLKNKLAQSKEELGELDVQEVEARASLEGAEIKVEALKIKISELQQLADDLMAQFQGAQRELSNYQTKLELHRRSIQELHTAGESLQEERASVEQRLKEYTTEKTQIEDETSSLRESFEKADSILKDKQKEIDVYRQEVETHAQKLEMEKREVVAGLSQRSGLTNQMHAFEAKVDSLSVQLSQLAPRLTDLQSDQEIFQEKVARYSEECEVQREEESRLAGELASTKETLTHLDVSLKDLRQREQKVREERTLTEARHKAIDQIVKNQEGLQADVKTILSEGGYSEYLQGAFADIVEAYPGYEFALESVLSQLMQTVFVDNSDHCVQIITDIKSKNLSRISLWATDLLKKSAQRANALSGELKELVAGSGGKSFSEVVRLNHNSGEEIIHLLSNYIVVDDLGTALKLFQQLPEGAFNLVTREGDLIDAMGRIAGGSVSSLESGIIAKKAELQKLSESLDVLVADQDRLSSELNELEERHQSTKQSYETLSAQHTESHLALKTVEKDLANAQQMLQNVQRDADRLATDQQRLESERQELWIQLDELRTSILALDEGSKEQQQLIEQKSAEVQKMQEELAGRQAGLVQLRIDFASANDKFKFAREKIAHFDKEIRLCRNKIDEIDRSVLNKQEQKEQYQTDLIDVEERLEVLVEKVTSLEDEFKERKNALEEARLELNSLYQNQKTQLKTLEEVTTRLSKLKVEHERNTLEYDNRLRSLFEKYGFEESAIAYDPAFDDISESQEKEMAEEVESLMDRIRRLGEVNVLAVEEYDSQKKRHEFLTSQRDDLLRSIHDLEKAIERINKTSEDRFVRAYEEINKRFQQIFPLVFGGGWAKLELTNPLDYMETGVEILAQPPGKKVGSIQLMSGGEKALTAVALIFSIFLIKPSPFCVLDEVDAPLDDHNVGKFNMLLKEMSQRSQFIIITHNKRTMELNNKLYGVTMEEAGVSKMVSIEMHG